MKLHEWQQRRAATGPAAGLSEAGEGTNPTEDNMTIGSATAPILQPMVRKVGERRFIAGVKFGGVWIFSEEKDAVTAGQARSAVGKLNEKLRAMKARVLLSEEFKMIEPAKAPIETPRAPVRRQVAAPKVAATLPKVAATQEGWITPRSDRAAWIENYRHAVQACTGFRPEGLEKLFGDAAKQFKTDVTAIMRSVGCIGPWAVNGDDIPWVRVAGEKDPTVAQIKAGAGDRRVLRDINGIKRINGGAQVEEGSPFRHLNEEREAAIAAQMATVLPAPKAAPVTPASAGYTYSFGSAEQRKLAATQGRRLMAQAKEQGKDADTQKLWGMIGFVISLRAMGLPPHSVFERRLKEAGVTEEYLREKGCKAA